MNLEQLRTRTHPEMSSSRANRVGVALSLSVLNSTVSLKEPRQARLSCGMAKMGKEKDEPKSKDNAIKGAKLADRGL